MRTITYKLDNGDNVELGISYKGLMRIKRENRSLFDDYNHTLFDKPTDIEDFFIPIYVAYLCANFDKGNLIPKEDFYDALGFDMYELTQLNQQIMSKSRGLNRIVAKQNG